jgi:hypothetical protein
MPKYSFDHQKATCAACERGGCLTIEHAITADMADGQPLPPLIEDGIVWCRVRRDGGRTHWRRLFLAPSPVTPGAASPGDQPRAPQRKS